jgi:hypothetical protein
MLFTTDDLAAYLQVDSVNDTTAVLLANLVEGLIVDEIGAVADPVPSGVLAVALEATARAYRNPDGVSSETIDDYTVRRDGSAPGVYLTGAEVARLHVADGGSPSRSVQLSPSWRVATN